MKQYFFTLLILCLLTASTFAAEAIPDPEKFSTQIIDDLARGRISDVAKKITDVAGQPEQKAAFENSLKALAGKEIDYRKKVIDKDYAGALRQIVHYAYVPDIGFLYFRFNYKRTSAGWVLAHFNFMSEGNELFPPTLNIE